MAVLTRLVLVAVLVSSSRVDGGQLVITPSTIVEGKTSTLTMRCEPGLTAIDPGFQIGLIKDPISYYIAIVSSEGPKSYFPERKIAAEGKVSPADEAFLSVVFTDGVSCSDAGLYRCLHFSDMHGSVYIDQTLQAVSDPGNITMEVGPTMISYHVNDTVEPVCSGLLGKPVNGSWVWETRDVTSGSTWTSLRPGLTPVDGTPAESGPCQMTGNSTLTFQVQGEDDNRMYRCYFRDPEYSANFTFRVIPATTTTPSPPPSTTSQGCGRSEVRGQAVGAGLAVWALFTFLLTLGGQGHVQPSTSKAPPSL